MARPGWLSQCFRDRVVQCIREIETRTSAEVVVTVRFCSGHYGSADLGWGALAAFAALMGYVFAPVTFPDDVSVLLIVLSFGVGSVFAANVPPLRRLLVTRRRRGDEVRHAARASFVEQGISRTRDRTGLLVYVSLFERRVEVVTDIGIPSDRIGYGWGQVISKLSATFHAGSGPDAFVDALREMGALLAVAVPKRVDDINELTDEVVAE